jgi:hypothetical protein
VLTENGYRPIASLENKNVKIWNGVVFSEVTVRETGQNQDIYRIELSNGQYLRCTGYHTWKLKGDVDKKTIELVEGDELKKYAMPVLKNSNKNMMHAYSNGYKATIDSEIPLDYSLETKLEWLAGFIVAHGNIEYGKNSASWQIFHKDLELLQKIQLLLTTLGAQPVISNFVSHTRHRILITSADTKVLYDLGLPLQKNWRDSYRQSRPSLRPAKVVSIVKEGSIPKVYCFNEPLLHTGCFNGIVTGQCSEQFLSRDGLCVLSSINMGKFSTSPDEYKKELDIIGESINRFLDNVNEMEYRDKRYASHMQKLGIEHMRRTGAGITNISEWLLDANLEYGTKLGNNAVAEFMDYYNYVLYKSTIKLGHEKGSFKAFHPEKIKKSAFIQHMLEAHPDLTFDAMRNVTVSSIAPTGSLSLMFRDTLMSNGIEPPFGLYYWKRTRISGKYEYYFVVPHATKKLLKKYDIELDMPSDTIKDTWDGARGRKYAEKIDNVIKEHGIRFKKDTDIKLSEKLYLMSKVAKNVDSAISVTYNLPSDVTVEDTYNFILDTHSLGVKAVAAFPDMKMYGIVSTIPFKNLAFKLKGEGIQIHAQNFSEEEQKELNITNDTIQFSEAPKRPKELISDIYVITIRGIKYLVAVGLLNGAPYEVFAGDLNGFNFKFTYKEGKLIKAKRSHYNLELGDIVIEDFNEKFKPVDAALFRMVSTSLRHGVSIKFIVEQLQKSSDDIFSLPKAVARALKKYIKDGDTASGITCPNCKNESLIYKDGCVECSSCNWTKCD